MRGGMLPVLDIMQTMPIFVYLIPFVMLFGPGKIPALLATIVFAIPPVIRLTDLGIRQVDPEIVEASRSFGASPVSYTHLDVYKRQMRNRPLRALDCASIRSIARS